MQIAKWKREKTRKRIRSSIDNVGYFWAKIGLYGQKAGGAGKIFLNFEHE